MAAKEKTSTKTTARPRRKTGTKRKGGGKRLFFHSWPSWWLWAGGIGAAVVYAVLFYHFFITPYSFRWRAIYREPNYPEGYDVRGIDISHYQGRVEWERVRNARINGDTLSFVIMKATEGVSLADEYFQRNFRNARRNDILRGAYHYFRPEEDARRQARFFIQTAALEPGDLPPILDVEERGSLSVAELQTRVKQWLDVVEKEYGVKPMIYTGRNFKDVCLNNKMFDPYPLWLAHYYVKEMTYNGTWAFWQHTDVGEVDGISGKVDCNIFNGTAEDLAAMTIPDPIEDKI